MSSICTPIQERGIFLCISTTGYYPCMGFLSSNTRVSLRDLNDIEVDLNLYLGWLRDVENNPFIESAKHDYRLSELKQYLATKLGDPNVKFWGIFTELDEFIGTVKLDPIDLHLGSAWLGIMIGEFSQRDKGYGKSALQQVSQYAYHTLRLRELLLGVHKNNLPAIKLYTNQGFRIVEENSKSFVMRKELRQIT